MHTFENVVRWLRRNWYGAFIAYLITFSIVYGLIWYWAEPIGIKDSFESLPDFAKTRIFLHLLLTFIITAHVIIILLVIELNFFKGDSVKKYGIEIHQPRNGDDVTTPFRIAGSYKIKPPEDTIRILEFSLNSRDFWIKNEVVFDESRKQWFAERVYIGGEDGEKREMSIAYFGEDGKAFIHYFEKVNQGRNQLIGTKKLPKDIQICDKILVTRRIPPNQN